MPSDEINAKIRKAFEIMDSNSDFYLDRKAFKAMVDILEFGNITLEDVRTWLGGKD